ncbi:MAG TPA: amidohydrolase family protein, partial [Terriglobales bacterium]|nr:amidohydrolase family protein [Terriglobales bacterium]
MKKLIKCGKLFNSPDGTVSENMAVLVDGARIESVIPLSAWAGRPTEGLEVIDLSAMFVTPGLIDAHMHLAGNGETDGELDEVLRTVGGCAIKALAHVQEDLLGGFTSVRALGDMGYIDVALRREIEAGTVWGPRIMASGPCIGSTGGHADGHFSPYVDIAISGGLIADGPDEVRKAARTVLKHGADLIKFMSTGGVMSRGTTVGAQQLTYEEIRAIVEVAEMYGVITATHAHGTNGIKAA